MGYEEHNPGTVAAMKSWYLWIPLNSFLTSMQKLDIINFLSEDSVASVEKVLAIIIAPTDLRGHSALFESDRRFPYPGTYVFVFSEYSASLISLLKTVKLIRSNLKEGLAADKFTSQIAAYLRELSRIKYFIAIGKHIYNQSKFEEAFKLGWH